MRCRISTCSRDPHLTGVCGRPAGGSILSTRCSETYETKAALLSLFGVPLWYFSQSPRVVIQVTHLFCIKHTIKQDTGHTSQRRWLLTLLVQLFYIFFLFNVRFLFSLALNTVGNPSDKMCVSDLLLLQPDVQPGNCWAFRGSTGFLVIRLSMRILPNAFSLEHIPKVLAPSGTLRSAPRDFSVYVRARHCQQNDAV